MEPLLTRRSYDATRQNIPTVRVDDPQASLAGTAGGKEP